MAKKKMKEKWKDFKWNVKKFANRNKRYELIQRDGLNILVETPESKARSDKNWMAFNTFITLISAAAAVVAAIYAALAYINP